GRRTAAPARGRAVGARRRRRARGPRRPEVRRGPAQGPHHRHRPSPPVVARLAREGISRAYAGKAVTPGAPSRPKHRSTRLAWRRGMALPKTGPSEAWMPTTRLHGRTRAVSRLGQGHSAAPRTGGSICFTLGALLRGAATGYLQEDIAQRSP